MTKERLEVYKCQHCGNIVEVMHVGGAPLHCCGEPMVLLTENTTDAATEKHVPAIEKVSGGYRVKVGDVEHPMTDAHYIQWIELIADNEAYLHFLNPGDKPEAEFKINASSVTAKAYCNLHGLWKKQS